MQKADNVPSFCRPHQLNDVVRLDLCLFLLDDSNLRRNNDDQGKQDTEG